MKVELRPIKSVNLVPLEVTMMKIRQHNLAPSALKGIHPQRLEPLMPHAAQVYILIAGWECPVFYALKNSSKQQKTI